MPATLVVCIYLKPCGSGSVRNWWTGMAVFMFNSGSKRTPPDRLGLSLHEMSPVLSTRWYQGTSACHTCQKPAPAGFDLWIVCRRLKPHSHRKIATNELNWTELNWSWRGSVYLPLFSFLLEIENEKNATWTSTSPFHRKQAKLMKNGLT